MRFSAILLALVGGAIATEKHNSLTLTTELTVTITTCTKASCTANHNTSTTPTPIISPTYSPSLTASTTLSNTPGTTKTLVIDTLQPSPKPGPATTGSIGGVGGGNSTTSPTDIYFTSSKAEIPPTTSVVWTTVTPGSNGNVTTVSGGVSGTGTGTATSTPLLPVSSAGKLGSVLALHALAVVMAFLA